MIPELMKVLRNQYMQEWTESGVYIGRKLDVLERFRLNSVLQKSLLKSNRHQLRPLHQTQSQKQNQNQKILQRNLINNL